MKNAKVCRRLVRAGFSKIDSGDDLNSFLKHFDDRSHLIVTVYHDGVIEVQKSGTLITSIYTPNEQELFFSTIEDKEYQRVLISLIVTGLALSAFLMWKLLG